MVGKIILSAASKTSEGEGQKPGNPIRALGVSRQAPSLFIGKQGEVNWTSLLTTLR